MAALIMIVALAAAWVIVQSQSEKASLIPIRIEKEDEKRPR